MFVCGVFVCLFVCRCLLVREECFILFFVTFSFFCFPLFLVALFFVVISGHLYFVVLLGGCFCLQFCVGGFVGFVLVVVFCCYSFCFCCCLLVGVGGGILFHTYL